MGRLLIEEYPGATFYSLELPVKDGLPGSAIPLGTYDIELAPSPKFLKSTDPWVQKYAKAMPHIIGIPGRSLILIHWGNEPTDTDGCILVGHRRKLDFLYSSRKAFIDLYPMIVEGVNAGECKITISGEPPPADVSNAIQ